MPSTIPSAGERTGYTLIEVLVVVSILALLAGLTLAAVQRVRTAAARTQCQNNLHQIAIAVQAYHATHGRLPTGVTAADDPNDPYPYLNWCARLLPHLEQSGLWDQAVTAYKSDPRFTQQPPHVAAGAVLPVFACPTDSRTASPATFNPQQRGLTSYLGVAGVNSVRRDGLLYMGSTHRLTDVTDGTSATLLVGERPPSADLVLGWWYAGWGQNKDGEGDGVLGVRTFNRGTYGPDCPEGPYHFTPGRFDNQCDAFHFWSPHPGGANFLVADGAVRFLSYSADPILPALATRAGGESVAIPD